MESQPHPGLPRKFGPLWAQMRVHGEDERKSRIKAGNRKRPSSRSHRPAKRGGARACGLSEEGVIGGQFGSIRASQVVGMEEKIP